MSANRKIKKIKHHTPDVPYTPYKGYTNYTHVTPVVTCVDDVTNDDKHLNNTLNKQIYDTMSPLQIGCMTFVYIVLFALMFIYVKNRLYKANPKPKIEVTQHLPEQQNNFHIEIKKTDIFFRKQKNSVIFVIR